MRRDKRRGFTLTEALVATVLAAILVVMLLQVLGDGARLTQKAQTRRAALALAEQVLQAQSRSGGAGAFEWEFSVEPSPFDPKRTTLDGYRLERHSVVVRGAGLGRPVTLITERLVK